MAKVIDARKGDANFFPDFVIANGVIAKVTLCCPALLQTFASPFLHGKRLFVHILSLWKRCLIFLLGCRALDAPNEHFVGQYDAAPIPRKKRPIFGAHCFGARCGTDVYIKPMVKFMYQK